MIILLLFHSVIFIKAASPYLVRHMLCRNIQRPLENAPTARINITPTAVSSLPRPIGGGAAQLSELRQGELGQMTLMLCPRPCCRFELDRERNAETYGPN